VKRPAVLEPGAARRAAQAILATFQGRP